MALVLPPVEEACPHGPGAHHLDHMQLALGDALAVALLERKRLHRRRLRGLPSRRQAGRQLLRVARLMHKDDELPLVAGSAAMARRCWR